MNLGISISNRAMSGFPLSIGTGLAFETLFSPTSAVYDKERTPPPKVDLKAYDTFWINLTTLFRNIYTAVAKEEIDRIRDTNIYATLLEEIDVIVNLVDSSSAGTKVQFYYSDYRELERQVNHQTLKSINLRKPHTDKQKSQYDSMMVVLDAVVKLHGEHIVFHDAITPQRRDKALVLTHQPYDLLNFNSFNDLHLLESNTGVVKKKHQFNSKYYPIPGVESGIDGMGSLPFHRKLLLIFGDKHLISPMPLVLRKAILEIARKRHWSPTTTIDKMNLDLSLDFIDPAMALVWKSI